MAEEEALTLVQQQSPSLVIQTPPPELPPPLDSPYFHSRSLIIPQRSSSSIWKFFHSSHNGFYYMNFPELILGDAEILFSKNGWLLMLREEWRHLFFFNPFTREMFDLPPTPNDHCFISACFTSSPTSSDCFVFGIFSSTDIRNIDFGLIRFGDDVWITDSFDCGRHYFNHCDCPPLYYNGKYYCLDHKWRSFRVFDPTNYEWSICGYCPEEDEDEDDQNEAEDDQNENEDDQNEAEDEADQNEAEDEDEDEDEDEADQNEDEDEEEGEKDDDKGNEDKEGEKEEREEKLELYYITKEWYIAEVEGEIWGVFVTDEEREVSVVKFDFSEMKWTELESLGNKCLYVSTNGSFVETCEEGDEMANKIYFTKFHDQNGVRYSLESGMYHSVAGDFASKGAFGLTHMEYGTWMKPNVD